MEEKTKKTMVGLGFEPRTSLPTKESAITTRPPSLETVLGPNLGLLPVLVESPPAFLPNMLGPNSFQSSHSSWSLDVTNHSYTDQWRGLQDSYSLHNFFLIVLRSGPRKKRRIKKINQNFICNKYYFISKKSA